MGTDSRTTRSGQKSSGKITTRSIARAPSNHTSLASPATYRSGPARPAVVIASPTPSAVRGGRGRRATAKRKSAPPPPARQPSKEDEILDEIIVTTSDLDDTDVEMSRDGVEALSGPGTPSA